MPEQAGNTLGDGQAQRGFGTGHLVIQGRTSINHAQYVLDIAAGQWIVVAASLPGFQLGTEEVRWRDHADGDAIIQNPVLGITQGCGVPAVAEPQDGWIIGHEVHGIRVVGTCRELPALVAQLGVDVLYAVESTSAAELARLQDLLRGLPVRLIRWDIVETEVAPAVHA